MVLPFTDGYERIGADFSSTLVEDFMSLPEETTNPPMPAKPIQIPVPFPSSVVTAYLDCITARNSDSTSFPDEFPFHETVGVCLLAKFMGSDDLVPFLWRHTHDYITSYQLLRWAAYENDNATMIRHAFKTMTTNQDLEISRDILLGVYSSSAQDLPARYRRQIVLRSAVPRRWWTEKDQVDNFIQGCASYRYEYRRWNGRQEEKAYLNV